MTTFEISQLMQQRAASGNLWLEFFRSASQSLSLGLYVIPAGGKDPQTPHTEDEIYYVLQGRGTIRGKDEDQVVGPGSIIFVAAHEKHHFHSVEEELSLLVFFAPAEYSKQ